MASGHVNRINRPNTWLHRPTLRREVLTCQPGAVHTWHIADGGMAGALLEQASAATQGLTRLCRPIGLCKRCFPKARRQEAEFREVMNLARCHTVGPVQSALCTRRRSVLLLLSLLMPLCSALARAEAPAPPVETEVVRVMPIVKKLDLSGTVTSPQASQLSTAVAGPVTAVHFDTGAHVKAGEVLLEIDAALEEATLKKAEAQAAQAAAEVTDAKRRLRIAERLAKRDYSPQNEVEARQAEVEIDIATYEAFKAERDRQAVILERHKLKAPYAGVISQRMAELGQWVVPGTAAFELVAMEGFRIDVPVPQHYYAQLRQGSEVSIKIDAVPDREFPAKIGAIIPVSDPDARTFTLRVLPEQEAIPMAPGMSARVNVSLRTSERGMVVSRDALIRYPDGRITVWVLEQNGEKALVRERRVEIGIAFEGFVQVRSGLKVGERVVVRGNESLRDGQAVQLAS
jgi:membrane fusion protein (multidrug efflux system)